MISERDEKELWARALPFLGRGRPGDTEHTAAAVEYGKTLLAHEGGNPLVVIPTLILHDVGWCRVDFSDFLMAPAEVKKDAESVRLHMRHGARIASEILKDLGFDAGLIEAITSIIAVHDVPEAIRALDDLNATLVFEADWLDKYSPVRLKRFSRAVKDQMSVEELWAYLEMNKVRWFRTKTAWDILESISGSPD